MEASRRAAGLPAHCRDERDTGCVAPPLAPMPALIVSASAERYAAAARLVSASGFAPRRTPAVFVNQSGTCRGTNGHRLAMRHAFRTIVAANVSMAIFEDDVQLAANAREGPAGVAHKIRAYIAAHADNDIIWLGGMGRLGLCKPGTDLACAPVTVPINPRMHGQVFGWNKGSARATHRLPATSSFYTDHAHFVTPRGAAAMLGCTRKCLVLAGAGIDYIEKHICLDAARRNSTALLEQVARWRRTFCEGEWRDGWERPLHCMRPPTDYWAVMPDQPTRDVRNKIFLGYFWQDRSNGSVLMQQRTALALQAEAASKAAAAAKHAGGRR